MRRRFVFGSISLFILIQLLSTSYAQSAGDLHLVEAGRLYLMSEHGVLQRERLQGIADKMGANFRTVGILYSKMKGVDSFPQLQPLDALVVYLDTEMEPQDVGPGIDDCPMQGHNVGESDILVNQSYPEMKERLGFDYDVETVQGSVSYICSGRLLLLYKLNRMLSGLETPPLTDQDIDSILASAGTHEVAHTLGAVHVFRVGDPLYIPAEGYFLGSVVTYAGDATKFDERNIGKMKAFISYAKSLKKKMSMEMLNDKKSEFLADFIVQQ